MNIFSGQVDFFKVEKSNSEIEFSPHILHVLCELFEFEKIGPSPKSVHNTTNNASFGAAILGDLS